MPTPHGTYEIICGRHKQGSRFTGEYYNYESAAQDRIQELLHGPLKMDYAELWKYTDIYGGEKICIEVYVK